MKRIYVSIGKPLEFYKFEENNAPMGWARIDLLKEDLKDSKTFRDKFTKEELKEINQVVE